MSSSIQIYQLDDGTDLVSPAPGYTLTPDDPLAAKLVALHAELRGKKLAACHILLDELIKIADDLPAASRDETRRTFNLAVRMAAWLERRKAEKTPPRPELRMEEFPQKTGEVERDLRRSALDHILKTGGCTKKDLRKYGFTAADIEAFGEQAIAQVQRLHDGASSDNGEAA